MHLLGQAQVGAEAGHEISGGDEVHAGLQSLQDQLETSADLLLGDPRDGADFCERRRERLSSNGVSENSVPLFRSDLQLGYEKTAVTYIIWGFNCLLSV